MLLQSQLRSLLRYHYVDNRDGTTGGASRSGIGSAPLVLYAPMLSLSEVWRSAKLLDLPPFLQHSIRKRLNDAGLLPVVLIDIAIADVAPNN